MISNFFEIQNGNFTASEKNKVNKVNLVIEKQGEIISLLGPSGIGKTTILRTIAGLQKLSGGKIKLRGRILASEAIHIEPEKRNVFIINNDIHPQNIEILEYKAKMLGLNLLKLDFNEIDERLAAGWYVYSGQRKRYLKSIIKYKKE